MEPAAPHLHPCPGAGGGDGIMGHGGYVHGSHAVDECLDEELKAILAV